MEVLWLTHLSWFNQSAELWCVLTRGRVSSISRWRQNYPRLWIKINYFLNLVISNVVSLVGTDLEDRRIVASSLYREVGSRVGWPGVPPADTLQEEPPLLSATHSWLSSSSPPGRRMQNTEIITVKLALFHHLILPAQPGLSYCPQIFSFQWSEIATGCFLSRQLAYFTTGEVSVRICRDKKPSKKCFCGSLTPPWVSACLSL